MRSVPPRLASAVFVLCSSVCLAQAAAGVSDERVKLPGAPGSIDGTGEKRSLTLRNRVINHLPKLGDSPDVTVRGTSAAIVELLMGGKPADVIASGAIKTDGRAAALTELLGMTTAPEFFFPIVTRPAWKA